MFASSIRDAIKLDETLLVYRTISATSADGVHPLVHLTPFCVTKEVEDRINYEYSTLSV